MKEMIVYSKVSVLAPTTCLPPEKRTNRIVQVSDFTLRLVYQKR